MYEYRLYNVNFASIYRSNRTLSHTKSTYTRIKNNLICSEGNNKSSFKLIVTC